MPRFLLPCFLGRLAPGEALDVASTRAVHAISPHDDHTHADALALVDELLALGVGKRTVATAMAPTTNPEFDAGHAVVGQS